MRGFAVALLIGLLAFGGGYLSAVNDKPERQRTK